MWLGIGRGFDVHSKPYIHVQLFGYTTRNDCVNRILPLRKLQRKGLRRNRADPPRATALRVMLHGGQHVTGKFFEKLVIATIPTVTEYHETIRAVLEEAYSDLPVENSDVAEYEIWITRWFGDI